MSQALRIVNGGLGAPARRPAPSGTVVKLEEVRDAGIRVWRVVDANGAPLNAGLFASQEWARRWAAGKGWRVLGPDEPERPEAAWGGEG